MIVRPLQANRVSLAMIASHPTMPKQRPTRSAASGYSAEALCGDIHVDADKTGSHSPL